MGQQHAMLYMGPGKPPPSDEEIEATLAYVRRKVAAYDAKQRRTSKPTPAGRTSKPAPRGRYLTSAELRAEADRAAREGYHRKALLMRRAADRAEGKPVAELREGRGGPTRAHVAWEAPV